MENNQFDEILMRLNIIINFLSLQSPAKISQKNKIEIISNMGMKPKDIAKLLGTTRQSVDSTLTIIRKKKSSKNK